MSKTSKSRKNVGGRIAANPRQGNICEGIALQMLRPFSAVAPLPREEDYGVDAIATLISRSGRAYSAGDSFLVQVKIHTAASFVFKGEGVEWLRNLHIPYFPLVLNLSTGTADLYTLNRYRQNIQLQRTDEFVFVPDADSNGYDDYPLGEPLMTWTLEECSHKAFPEWAFSVLQPAVKIETLNRRYAKSSRFFKLEGGAYLFENRDESDAPVEPPLMSGVSDYVPIEPDQMLETLENAAGPLAYAIANLPGMEDKGEDLLKLRELMRGLGINPDPDNQWDEIIEDL